MKEQPFYFVAIGTSAGGHAALRQLVAHLDSNTNATYCIVIHLSDRETRSTMAERLQPLTSLSCKLVQQDMPIEKGCIYVAQPGRHLLVKDGKFMLGYGPEENNHRPSINVLFRSVAVAYRSQAIGVVLTGLLSDGTAGMEAIKSCGGTTIVQDPHEAEFSDMPKSVLSNVQTDHIASLSKIGLVITDITKMKKENKGLSPAHILAEAQRSEKMAAGIEGMDDIGEKSSYGCPECGGILWETGKTGSIHNFRCHTGHVYTQTELLLKQAKEAESAIWIAIRIMEERKHLLLRIASEFSEKNSQVMEEVYTNKAKEVKNNIDKIKDLLVAIEDSSNIPPFETAS